MLPLLHAAVQYIAVVLLVGYIFITSTARESTIRIMHSHSAETTSGCRYSDSLNLVKFYNETRGEQWQVKWKLNTPMDDWYGVKLNEKGCVEYLDLNHNKLRDSISTLVFPELKGINISNNDSIKGSIPNLDELTKLEWGLFRHNQFTGSIPEVNSLVNLEKLDFSANKLSGSIPEINNLTKLTSFLCYSNNLSGSIPDVDTLSNLRQFSCRDNNIGGRIPSLDNLSKLTHWDCSNNSITGEIPSFDDLSSLESFACINNQLSGSLPHIDHLSKLKGLYFSHNNLSGDFPKMDNLQNLSNFHCSFNNISGNLPEIDKLINLVVFDCSNNSITGNIPSLDKLQKLLFFYCNDNNIAGTIPKLDILPRLSRFYVSNNNLSGCYPDGSLCRLRYVSKKNGTLVVKGETRSFFKKNGYNLTGNPLLPWQGDYEKYCAADGSQQAQVGAPCMIDGRDGTIDESCACITATTTSCRTQDSLKLVKLYNETGGDQWTHKWDLSTPINTWHGIRLTSEGCVERINLSNNGLMGSITTLVFPELTYFYCSRNSLSGSIPSLDNVPNLELFYCSNNSLSGSIPSLDNVPNLRGFYCSSNSLSGSIPSLENVPNLEWFDCSRNSLSRNIPSLDNVSNLEWFDCSRNSLTGDIPSLENVPNLEWFGCESNTLTGNIPSLENVPNLLVFYCPSNSLSGNIPSLDNVPNLSEFFCYDNSLSGNIPSLDNVSDLVWFDCSDNQLEGSIPDLSKLTELRSFYAFHNNLSGCYPDTTLCSLGFSRSTLQYGYNLTGNPLLPWQGDYQKYCATDGSQQAQVGAPCEVDGQAGKIDENCDCVICPSSLALPPEVIRCPRGTLDLSPYVKATYVVEGVWSSAQNLDIMDSNILLDGLQVGNYQLSFTWKSLCEETQSDTVNLIIQNSNIDTTILDVIRCDSYLWNGQEYTTTGIYTYRTYSIDGCDSIVQLDLTVSPSITTTLWDTICSGESLFINGKEYGGDVLRGIDTLATAQGCDSIVDILITELESHDITEEVRVCRSKQHILPDGFKLSIDDPEHSILYQSVHGCDSTVMYVVTPISDESIECIDDKGINYIDDGEKVVTPLEGASFEAIDENTLSISIYGRWGNRVFYLKNPPKNLQWNGTTTDGRPLPEGAYYYFIEQRPSKENSKGFLRGYISLFR